MAALFMKLTVVVLLCGSWLLGHVWGQTTSQIITLNAQSREPVPTATNQWQRVESILTWDPGRTAVVICDMWDRHWCRGATERVAEMAPRMNQFIIELRRRGVLIIHAPSETMKFYENHPARQRARNAPILALSTRPPGWCAREGIREPDLPIEVIHDGCDDLPVCAPLQSGKYPWTRQVATLEIPDQDAITDSLEAIYLMKQRGIKQVLIMGVHVNMCVLGRPFAIRQLVYQGFQVVLVRDLTDAMYCSRGRPGVDHFTGNDLVIEHIEKYWCPTVTSDQILGGSAFVFKADRRTARP